MPDKDRITYLLSRYFEKTSTPAEEEELLRIIHSAEHDSEIRELMDGLWNQLPQGDRMHEMQSHQVFANISAKTFAPETIDEPGVRKISLGWKSMAAAILLLITAGIVYLLVPRAEKQMVAAEKVQPAVISTDIAPAPNKTILTLADHSVLDLEDQQDGIVATQGNVQISKKQGDQLVYTSPTDLSTVTAGSFNTITTSTGGQYQISLPDGTKVWLNARSALKFPVAFSGTERTVELTGEAYFEVATVYNGTAKQKRPFVVRLMNDRAVEVLGTHFNVKAYDNEEASRTTLLEGSVRMKNGNHKKMLQPGEQASLSSGTEIRINKNAAIEHTMAWKNGLFDFRNESIENVMRQLTRWYDISVEYEDHLPTQHYTGAIRRQANLSQVLQMLELAGTLQFTIRDSKIIIRNK